MVVKKEYWFICFVLVGLSSACSESSKKPKETNTKTSVNKPSNENTKIQAPNHQTVGSSQSTATAKTENVPNQERLMQFTPPKIVEYDDEYPPTVKEITDRDWTATTQSSSDDNVGFTEPAPMPEIRKDYDVYDVVDEPAEFLGGMTALRDYLMKNVKYPAIAKDAGIQGKCYLRFVVNTDGSVSDVKVLRGVSDCPECDQEALRVVKNMPNWIPGKINGKVVKMYYNLPISFKLTN